MKTICSAATLLTVSIVIAATMTPRALQADELPSIFNGKDLTGWKVPENNVWWKAEEGVLKVKSGPNKTSSTLWTEKEYTNFVMEFEFKLGEGTVDSGIYVRNAKEQIQIGISGSLKRDMTASPYISGKGYPVEAKGVGELLKLDDWNEMTIVAKGKNYTVWLNGKYVMTYDSESAIKKGPVGIQLHGNRNMSIDYRKIKLAELN